MEILVIIGILVLTYYAGKEKGLKEGKAKVQKYTLEIKEKKED